MKLGEGMEIKIELTLQINFSLAYDIFSYTFYLSPKTSKKNDQNEY